MQLFVLCHSLHAPTDGCVACRSNKRDASRIIAKRVTRMMKIAAHKAATTTAGNVDEAENSEDAAAAMHAHDEAAEVEDVGVAAAAQPGDVQALHGDVNKMTHGKGRIISVDNLRSAALPDGAQFRGT